MLYTDGTYEFVKNRVNMRYRVMDMPAERAGLHLMDELREMEADGRYKVKVRVHAPAAAMKSVDKAALLEAGAAKVELVADDEQLPEAVSSSLFEIRQPPHPGNLRGLLPGETDRGCVDGIGVFI